MHILIPNASVLSRHLAKLAAACSATEVVLFERTTFLVIATSTPPPPPPIASTAASAASSSKTNGQTSVGTSHNGTDEEPDLDPHKMAPTRYERTSELIKAFKYSCARVREEFHALEMELPEFTAVLDELTRNTYVLIVVHDPTIGKYPHKRFSIDMRSDLVYRDRSAPDEYSSSSVEVRRAPRRQSSLLVATCSLTFSCIVYTVSDFSTLFLV